MAIGWRRLSTEGKREAVALGIFSLWVIAWIGGWVTKEPIPAALNVTMPAASAYLLGTNLPVIGPKRKEPDGTKEP